MKKRITALLLLLTLSVTSLFACTSADKSESASDKTAKTSKSTSTKKQELTPVTLNEVAHSIFYAPMYVAIEKGYFANEGIDLSLVTGFGVSQLVQDDFDYPTYTFPPYLAAIQPDGICIQISLLIILHSKQNSPCVLSNNAVWCKSVSFLECNYCRICSSTKDSIYFATVKSKTIQSLLNQSCDISSCSFSTGWTTCKSVLSWNAINNLFGKSLSITFFLQSAYPVVS